jgi:hypothetical protein
VLNLISGSQLLVSDPQLMNNWLGWSVKLLLAFASTVIPDFDLLEIHDKDFSSLPDMYLF